MKVFLQLCLLTIAIGTAARADIILTWDNPDQVAVPGDTLHYLATIVNTGTDTVYLNSDDLTFDTVDGLTPVDGFANTVLSLDGGQEQDAVELVTISVDSGFTNFGKYTGTYTLLGGADGSALDVLATSPVFSVTTEAPVSTPEPGTFAMLGAGVVALAVKTRNKRRT